MYILVIEDTMLVQRVLMTAIQYVGYDAVGYATGRDALQHLRTHDETPGLVFLDVMLPQMDGWGVLHELQCNPQLAMIPVVMMSAGGDHRRQAIANGAVDFIQKPFGIEIMKYTINRYCSVCRS